MSKPKIIALVGVPASGKTTYRKAHKDVWYTSRDEIRENLFGWPYKMTKDRERQVTEHSYSQIRAAIELGRDIIVDETFCKLGTRNKLIEFAKELNVEVEWVIMQDSFDVDLCHKRNTARERSVPFNVIENMFLGFIDFVKEREEGKWLPKLGSGHMPCVIVDIDGTIADNKGIRSPYEFDKVLLDKPKQFVIDLVNNLSQDYYVIVLSGRDGSCREDTLKWLDKHSVCFDKLYMREAGDARKDFRIKMELVSEFIEKDFDVQLVIDDRNCLGRYWEALNLNFLKVGNGNYF